MSVASLRWQVRECSSAEQLDLAVGVAAREAWVAELRSRGRIGERWAARGAAVVMAAMAARERSSRWYHQLAGLLSGPEWVL